MQTEQDKQIDRVSGRIEKAIMAFCRNAFSSGGTFHMEHLLEFVRLKAGVIAPDSPGRILRQLRAAGQLDYVVVSRAQSRYEITSIQGAQS